MNLYLDKNVGEFAQGLIAKEIMELDVEISLINNEIEDLKFKQRRGDNKSIELMNLVENAKTDATKRTHQDNLNFNSLELDVITDEINEKEDLVDKLERSLKIKRTALTRLDKSTKAN